MKASLIRLKAIIAAYFTWFVGAAILTGLLYVVIGALDPVLNNHFHKLVLTRDWKICIAAIFFVLPIYDRMNFQLANATSGTTSISLDIKVMKRNLFIASGVLWASIAGLAIGLLLNNEGYLLFSTALIGLLTWHTLTKLMIKYVFTL
jgi:tetrahydromethanopterin S-methyltransferase subunit F